jgi:predicted HTH transcriptional regulator
LEGITAVKEVVAPVTLDQEIAEGESAELEFKSTLRWDLNEQEINKRLEDAVLKTVAAFANSQGGSLLIGVNDDGEVLGLEHDYASLGDVDRDGLELHIRNLLNQAFGKGVVASHISIKFPTVADQMICRVVVKPVSNPIFLKTFGKDGEVSERFYVRSGNSSQEIPSGQLKEYWDQRFV